MSRRKIALLALAGAFLLATAVILLLLQDLDGVVRRVIETSVGKATGTAVQVGRVSLSLREGRGSVNNLIIANPTGFSDQPLLSLAAIEIRIDPAQLTAEVPIIDEIRVGPATFHYEINRSGESNLRIVQKQVRREPKMAAADPPAPRPPEKRFRIRRLVVADGTATLELGQIGAGEGLARVPGITLTDLGGPQGATAEELAGEILAALGKNLSTTVGGDSMKRLGDSLGEAFRKRKQH